VIAFAEHLARLKRQFLELLDKDKEFRLAVAGYLGLSETLMRLESVEKSIEKLLEEVKRSREGQDKLWENVSRLWEEVNIYGASDDLCVVGEARLGGRRDTGRYVEEAAPRQNQAQGLEGGLHDPSDARPHSEGGEGGGLGPKGCGGRREAEALECC